MEIQESVKRDLLRLLVWYPVRWVLLVLPFRWGIRVLRLMGDLHFLLGRKRGGARKILANVGRMPGVTAGAEDVLRRYYQNHYVDRLLIFLFPKLSIENLDHLVEIEGLDRLDLALQKRKGVILVHGHFGPVHLPLVALALLGYPIKQIGLPSDDGLSWVGRKVAFRLRMHYERKIPAEIVKADSYLRGVYRWLAGNGLIMVTGDGTGTSRRLGKQHLFRLFGHPVLFPLGPAHMGLTTGAAILPIVISPGRAGFLYRIEILPPLAAGESAPEPTVDISAQFVRVLEERIRQHPYHMHFLDRFCPGEMIVEEIPAA